MTNKQDTLLHKIRDWAEKKRRRACNVTNQFTGDPVAPADQFSDLDIEWVVKDLPAFLI
jgi:hypothetical protein